MSRLWGVFDKDRRLQPEGVGESKKEAVAVWVATNFRDGHVSYDPSPLQETGWRSVLGQGWRCLPFRYKVDDADPA